LNNVDHRLADTWPNRGFAASKIVNAHGQGILLDIVLGIVGAVVGGFDGAGGVGVTGFNAWSFLVAITRSSCSLSITPSPDVALSEHVFVRFKKSNECLGLGTCRGGQRWLAA
jgi:uncharacterized membrane protein YeaQ/YmgE (transglycosylase-associated protein family)